jgi:hypothetical protein
MCEVETILSEIEARHMPLFRYTVRGMMIAVAFVASVLALLATHHSKQGCGQTSVPLVFHVVDDRDGRPVHGATVELYGALGDPPTAKVTTGTNGSVGAICRAGSTSYRGPFFRPYRTLHYSESLRIGAEGYQAVDGLLSNFMTDPAYRTNRAAHPPILIRLKRESGSDEV